MPRRLPSPAAARRCAALLRRCLAATLPLLAASACAAPAGTTLHGFSHSAWTMERGAPGDIWDIAQAADGTLRLATGSGLYRFDGRSFSRVAPPPGSEFPSSNMTTLQDDGRGGWWIGYFDAGASHLDARGMRHYRHAQGMPGALLPRLQYDASGRLWAASDGGLRWFDGQRWQAPAAAFGFTGTHAHWLLRDQRGALWIAGSERLWVLDPGATGVRDSGVAVAAFANLAQAPDGTLWLADRRAGLVPVADASGMLTAAARHARALPALRAERIRFSRDGSLWASLLPPDGGLARIRFDGNGMATEVARFGTAQGLTSPRSSPLLEDREGNLWVGTNLGLDRFRPLAVHRLAAPADGAPQALFRDRHGRVFGYGEALRAYPLRAASSTATPASDDGGDVWSAIDRQLRHWHRRHGEPGTANAAPPRLHALASGDGEQAWACFDDGVAQWQAGRGWRHEQRLPAEACSVAALHGDTVLLGYADGRLRRLHGTTVTTDDRDDGLDVGPITAIDWDASLPLVAGERGLAVGDAHGRFRRLQAQPAELLDGINGIARDAAGQVWLYGVRGLVRIERGALQAAARDGTPLRHARLFDGIDGLPGISRQAGPVPTLQLDRDGVLWLSSNQGLAWLDTRQPHRNPVAPQVAIGDISFGAQRLPLRDGLALPKRTSQLQIDYAATALARPDRLRYRYRLVGLEQDWHDAGELTRASYANLGPGRYRFEVVAENEDGVASTVATRAFRIQPAFTQTAAFKVLCVALVLGTLVAAVRLRSRQLGARMRVRLEERHLERERIARELHDTLLQGTQGLILRLHAASQRLPADDPTRDALETAMTLAERHMAAGRERVSGLRDRAAARHELGRALLQVHAELPPGSVPEPRLLVEGAPLPLRPDVAEELQLIGREALLNAFRHADAQAVEIELGYGTRTLCLRIRDDGRGLPGGQSAPAHWGLAGMHERARRIGATLSLWSRPGAGTEVQVSLPASRAYLPRSRRSAWRWLRPTALHSGDQA